MFRVGSFDFKVGRRITDPFADYPAALPHSLRDIYIEKIGRMGSVLRGGRVVGQWRYSCGP